MAGSMEKQFEIPENQWVAPLDPNKCLCVDEAKYKKGSRACDGVNVSCNGIPCFTCRPEYSRKYCDEQRLKCPVHPIKPTTPNDNYNYISPFYI